MPSRLIPSLALAACLAAGTSASANELEYQKAIYAFLVARHCELATDEVREGFRLTLSHLLQQDRIAPDAAREARARAGESLRMEWRNRGSGARDPRCPKQGRAAAQRFRDFLYAGDNG